MEDRQYLKYSTEDFILDKKFSGWVINPDKESDQFWHSFIHENPEKSDLIRNAALIIKSLQPITQEVPQQRLNAIFQKISISSGSFNYIRYSLLKYVAGIALLITAVSLIWVSVQNKHQFPAEVASGPMLKGKIILSNGATREFDTEQTTLKQTSSGSLTLNDDTIADQSANTTTSMNQIIIPYGKRSEITLADGTHIWLNSGSQLSYPSEFKTDSREVFLSGEAFFDVKLNPNKPFFVITRDVKIKVLGTSFNVSSYNEDNSTQTVLVKGKVSAGKNKLFAKTIDLTPGERMIFDKIKDQLSKDHVNVELYASWVNGYLIFDNVPITEVYKKLGRYYNQTIQTEDGLEKITFSGKLDLKDNIKDVLENISFASSVKIFDNNGSFIITK